jgi:hypothetical protein
VGEKFLIRILRGPVPESLLKTNGKNIEKMSQDERRALKEELEKLFFGKCAYCETYVGDNGAILISK